MTVTPRQLVRGLSDVVILLGLGLLAYGLFQLSAPVGWIFVGLVAVGLGVIVGLPPTTRGPSAPRGNP